MNWTIPGTTLEGLRSNADRTDGLFQSMFLAGGLTLSQVASVTGALYHSELGKARLSLCPQEQAV